MYKLALKKVKYLILQFLRQVLICIQTQNPIIFSLIDSKLFLRAKTKPFLIKHPSSALLCYGDSFVSTA